MVGRRVCGAVGYFPAPHVAEFGPLLRIIVLVGWGLFYPTGWGLWGSGFYEAYGLGGVVIGGEAVIAGGCGGVGGATFVG